MLADDRGEALAAKEPYLSQGVVETKTELKSQ